MAEIVLHATDITFGYKTPLCSPLSLILKQGEVVAILGTNGRGKTTLLHTLVGILPTLSGSIRCVKNIGYVPQHNTMSFDYLVLDVVLMGLSQRVGLFYEPTHEDETRALALLVELGIAHLAHSVFNHLSGGQQQLILLARALMSEADFIVLDEPTSALDLANQQIVLNFIAKLAKEQKKTVLFTTHDPYHAQLVADRCLLLLPEQQWLYAPVYEALQENRLECLYGLPLCCKTLEDDRKVIFPLFSVQR